MISKRLFYSILFLSFITCLTGMILIPLMDIDAAQYASISREMLERKSYLQFYDIGADYLDKPPMLFWLSALSLKIFGIHDWAYRLPSFGFAILAVYATYHFTLLYYYKTTAQLAAIVLATSQALFLITHDVRCDTMLMGWVILSIWQLAAWFKNNQWKHFLFAFIAIAGGMMTKGPIALIVPIIAFSPHFILQREWKQFFRWEYLIGIIIIAILLIPMSIGLYQQFDLHPGKLINNIPIKSGLRFYYWTQSFGRYTGENIFHEMSYFTFLLENMLWSFLPWVLFFLVGLIAAFRAIILNKFYLTNKEEWISTGGFVLTYCILARSQAQLPHYIFVVFPLAAIITAKFLHQLFFTNEFIYFKKPLIIIHAIVFSLLWFVLLILMRYPFKELTVVAFGLSILSATAYFWYLFKQSNFVSIPKIIFAGVFTILSINILLSTNFYPNLLQYQMGNTAAAFINQQQLPKDKIVVYGDGDSRALYFYGQYCFKHKANRQELLTTDIVITYADSIKGLKQVFPNLKQLHTGAHFAVSQLTAEFLNPVTRASALPYYAIIDLDGKP